MMEEVITLKLGTRNSQLALIQTDLIKKNLNDIFNQEKVTLDFQVVSMTTTGDEILDRSLVSIKSTALFTRELEAALLAEEVDLVVHSLKDLPTTLPIGCCIGAVFKRHDREDSIVLSAKHRGKTDPLDLLMGKGDQAGKKVVIGTSSQRRIAMINRNNPSAECVDIRGNLNTRFRKLDDDDSPYDAVILAKAGLDRMDWAERSSLVLTPENGVTDWCYAVGQGAIAVECRTCDKGTLEYLKKLIDPKTSYEVVAERALMKRLEAGCSAPLGVRVYWTNNVLTIKGVVLSIDGKTLVEASGSLDLDKKITMQDVENDTTNIIFPPDMPGVSFKAKACSRLGLEVAEKLIAAGCMQTLGRI